MWQIRGRTHKHVSDKPILNPMLHSTLSVIICKFSRQKQPLEVFYKEGVLKNFTKFTGKHLQQSLFLNCNFTKSDSPPCVFCTFFKLCKWYQIAQNIRYKNYWIKTSISLFEITKLFVVTYTLSGWNFNLTMYMLLQKASLHLMNKLICFHSVCSIYFKYTSMANNFSSHKYIV